MSVLKNYPAHFLKNCKCESFPIIQRSNQNSCLDVPFLIQESKKDDLSKQHGSQTTQLVKQL